jgi:dCMP deaminase
MDKALIQECTDTPILAYLCEVAGNYSPDPRTQTAACLYDPNTSTLVMPAFNRFPRQIENTPERWDRPAKYSRVVHAEVGSVLEAARVGIPTVGLWMYAVWAACGPCAGVIIDAGLTRLITLDDSQDPGHWDESIKVGFEMLAEAGVEVTLYEHPVTEEGVTILRDGKPFRP